MKNPVKAVELVMKNKQKKYAEKVLYCPVNVNTEAVS
jgi:hypothetical protein